MTAHRHQTRFSAGNDDGAAGEDDAGGAHGDELPAAVAENAGMQGPDEQSDSRGAGREGERNDAGLHGRKGDVALGEGAVGAQPVGFVGSFHKVPEVVHQIGRALHQHGEQQAQQGRKPVERAVGAGQSRADEDEDHGVAQTIRPHGQYPGGKGVSFHRRGFISAGMVFSG